MTATEARSTNAKGDAQATPLVESGAEVSASKQRQRRSTERHPVGDVRKQHTSATIRDGSTIGAAGNSAPARPITRRTIWSGWLLLLLGTPLALLACSGLSHVFEWSTPMLIGVDAVTALIFIGLSIAMFIRSTS